MFIHTFILQGRYSCVRIIRLPQLCCWFSKSGLWWHPKTGKCENHPDTSLQVSWVRARYWQEILLYQDVKNLVSYSIESSIKEQNANDAKTVKFEAALNQMTSSNVGDVVLLRIRETCLHLLISLRHKVQLRLMGI